MFMDSLLVLLVLVVLAGVILMVSRSSKRERHFDERQLMLRARGYRLGYTVTVVLMLLLTFLLDYDALTFVSPALGVYAVLMIGLVTFAVFCIMNDVFFSVGEKGGYYIVICAAIVVLDGLIVIARLADGSLLESGVLTFSVGSSAVMALGFLVILAALVIRKLRAEREADE